MRVLISGQVTGFEEAYNVMQVAKSQHFGGGQWTTDFERKLSQYTGHRFAVMANSGSSANLLALAALELPKRSRVLTCAVNFPTTISAIVQLGHIPVFVDADPQTLNAVDFSGIKADAAIFAHTLGNPLYIPPTSYPVIEDCCDALGSLIDGQLVGRRGVMATCSFYPAHHITTGEGGAVFVDNPRLKKVIESYRDWGRDCWCEPGEDNTCGKRYAGDYDHKYSYSRIGYNLKASDFQAAVGMAQMERLEGFIRKRRSNWQYLYNGLKDLPIEIISPADNTMPSWFGFAFLTDRRNELARYLDRHEIGNRPIMGGNLLRQKAFRDIECVVVGSLDGANRIHDHGLYIGVFPGITVDMLDYVIEVMRGFYS